VFCAQEKQGYTVPYSAERVKKDQRRGANREKDVAAERIDEHGQRLERQHPHYAAHDERECDLTDAGSKPDRKQLVQDGP
jgi:hypothetical protein